jgi:SAM-dependent methyltransferase
MSNATLNAPRNYPTVDYDAHARTCAPEDFWAQVKRTVRGQPVSEDQIEMIVDAIQTHLSLQSGDAVLDLACGNGELSRRLFAECGSWLGVDLSDYLIEVANRHFADPPRINFVAAGAAEYLTAESQPERFSKVLCYGSFAYFSQTDAQATLQLLHERFVNVGTIFIGNLPDRARASAFYAPRQPEPGELTDPKAQIGIWRTREEFAALAAETGWEATFPAMPPGFFAAKYRYDAVLRRHAKRGGQAEGVAEV